MSTNTMADISPAIIMVDDSYSPYMFGTKQSAKGLYSSLINAISERANLNITLQATPWKRALALSARGDVGIGGIYKNKQREDIYDYSAPIFTENLWIYVKTDTEFPFSNLTDLKNKKGAINLGWSYGNNFDQLREAGFFKVEEYGDNLTNIKKLISLPRIDFTVIDEIAALKIIQDHNFQDQVKKLEPAATSNNAYIAFSKEAKRTHTLAKFNRMLAIMQKDGTYSEIIDKFKSRAQQ